MVPLETLNSSLGSLTLRIDALSEHWRNPQTRGYHFAFDIILPPLMSFCLCRHCMGLS